MSVCRKCLERAEYYKKYYARKKEHLKEYGKQYYRNKKRE